MMFMHTRRNLIHFSEIHFLRTRNSHINLSLLSLVQFFSTSGVIKKQTSPEIFELLLHKHHLCPETASQVASSLTVTGMKTIERFDSTLSFLKDSGFSNTQLEKMLKYRPTLLSANPEKVINPKIKLFQDLNFSAKDIAEIITNDPDILYRSLNKRVVPSLLVLKDLLGSSLEVAKVLKISGWFLKYDIGNTMAPNIEFLKKCGVAGDQISWLMFNYPRSLLCKPEIMKKFVEKADEMRIKRSSRMFVYAVKVFCSMSDETWENKVRAVRKLGFTEDDIAATFRNVPFVFGLSEQKMKEVKEILLATGKYEMKCIVDNPVSLLYSVEKRYKPRIKVLEILECKNLIEEWPSLARLCRMTGTEFYEKFVGPYLDQVGDVYITKG